MSKQNDTGKGNDTADIREFSLGVSEGGLSGKYVIPVKLSFAGVSRGDIIDLTIPGLRVKLQNSWRKRGDTFCKALATKGATLHVNALELDVTDEELLDTVKKAFDLLGVAPDLNDIKRRISDPAARAELVSRFYNKR